jgi:hypothetical protein
MRLPHAEPRVDEGDGLGGVEAHELGVDAHDAVAHASELLVAARIRAGAGGVIPAVDFHDELRARREEVDDEATHGDLPAKPDAEAAAAKACPQLILGVGEPGPVLTSAKLDDGERTTLHDDLRAASLRATRPTSSTEGRLCLAERDPGVGRDMIEACSSSNGLPRGAWGSRVQKARVQTHR